MEFILPGLQAIGFALLGYFSGSLSFALWITRAVKSVDVRDSGSGHATATNTLRQAGFWAGLLVFLLDFSKGMLPTYLAYRAGVGIWLPALTAASVVVGHCWPVWAGFRGGMGLAAAGGSIFALSPLAFLLGVGILILFVLSIHHSARAAVIAAVVLPLVLWYFHLGPGVTALAAAVGLVIAYRFLIDWNRKYRELWLDRP